MKSPWDWRPGPGAWCRQVAEMAASWKPLVQSDVDTGAVTAHLCRVAAGGEPWLYHPCLSALTRSRPRSAGRDLQLLAWAAAHGGVRAGRVVLTEDMGFWGPGGGVRLCRGSHSLASLAELAGARTPWPLGLDMWSLAAHTEFSEDWPEDAAEPADSAARNARLFFRTLTAAQRFLPPIIEWASGATKVVVPLRNRGPGWRSGSSNDLPGLIWLDLLGALQIMEGLVHETAHHYFFLAEAAGGFVDKSHDSSYPSPFRSDMRPLRNVLLAYHALAYISRLYADARSAGFLATVAGPLLAERMGSLMETKRILIDARRHLTDDGNAFFEQTTRVAESVA